MQTKRPTRVSSFLAQTMTFSLSAKANVANDVILKELLVSEFDTVQKLLAEKQEKWLEFNPDILFCK